jgi:anti-sigma factor RsiW
MTDLMTCQSKDLLLAYLYDEVTPDERSVVETHLAECADCRADVDGLTGVRQSLTAWEAPPLRSHFRVVSEEPAKFARWKRWQVALPLAAAAVIVLAAAAGLANLEVRYGADGVMVRTGWGNASAVSNASHASVTPVTTSGASGATAPWRPEITALEQELRREFTASRGVVPSGTPALTPVSSRASNDDLLRRMQQLIDESEVRQQRNLALRMAEVSRDFSIQRQTDLVQIQQGLGRLEGRTEAEAAKARELMNYIMRVSQQQPAPR